MAVSSWLIVVGACLLYVALGLWAVSQIFPLAQEAHVKQATAPQPQKEGLRK